MKSQSDSLRVKEIFEKAIEFTSTDERQGYVSGTCNGDSTLLSRVETLLRAHFEDGDSFLPGNPAAASASFVANGNGEKAGAIIGRYKLLQKIGEGGCGVVWMAEQGEPVRRRVALKLIRLGMDTREFIARFEAERQALALMDHPSIAQVFDAGATENGRPYLVMELIRGTPITKYCDENSLPLRARLELFVRVCGAVQHAHQKGVIHRDIKPSNILVIVVSGEPLPKVIDFGIAKAVAAPLTEKTVCTRIDALIGTPAYSSPEQMEIGLRDVDTRADIYSLGVLLYELLTGRQPFDRAELQRATFDEMRRTIREVEPPRPSQRFANLTEGERTDVAARREADPRQFPVLLRSDLDWIVMRCLEKERARRYETANALAMDIRHHLENEPVAARPPSSAYRLRKFIRRYRTPVIAVAAVVISLAGGLIAAGIALRNEQAARERAVAAELSQEALRRQADVTAQQARDSAEQSRQVAQFMKDMLRRVGPSVARGRDTSLLREVLEDTIHRLDTDLRGQPEVAAELRHTLGITFREIGEYGRAEKLWRESIAVRRALGGEVSVELAATLHELGSLLWLNNEPAEADQWLLEALAIRERVHGPDHFDVGTTLAALAFNLGAHRSGPDREAKARRAVAIQRKHPGHDDDEFAQSLVVLAHVLYNHNRPLLDEAESCFRESADIRQALPGGASARLADSLGWLGRLAFSEREDEAQELAWRRRQLAIVRELRGPANGRLVGALLAFTSCRFPPETFADDLQLAHEVVADLSTVLPDDSPDLAVAQLALASMIDLAPGRSADGEARARDAVARIRRARENGVLPHRDTSIAMQLFAWRTHVGNRLRYAQPMAEELNRDSKFGSVLYFGPPIQRTLGRIYFDLGRFDEAIPLLEASSRGEHAIRRPASPRHRENLLTDCAFLGYAYRRRKQSEESRRILEWGLARKFDIGEEHDPAQSSRAAVRCELGFTSLIEGKFAEAETLLRAALEEYTKTTGKDALPGIQWIKHFPRGRIMSGLGQALAKQDRATEAEPLLLEGYSDLIAQREKLWGNPTPILREALEAVVAFYRDTGQPEKAGEWEAKGAGL